MTAQPAADRIHLDREHAASLARLLRQLGQFLDECDDGVEGALAAFSGLNPACEAFSAALCRLFAVEGVVGGALAGRRRGLPSERPRHAPRYLRRALSHRVLPSR
jgi:hypothetical protein